MKRSLRIFSFTMACQLALVPSFNLFAQDLVGLGMSKAGDTIAQKCQNGTLPPTLPGTFGKSLCEVTASFEPFDATSIDQESELDFQLNFDKLGSGKTQIFGEIKEKKKFDKSYPHIKNLDSKFFNLLEAKNKHDYVFTSRQAYLLKDVDVSEFNAQLYRDPKFIKKAYKDMEYTFPEDMEKTGSSEVATDFSWIVTQKLPWPLTDMRSKINYHNYSPKDKSSTEKLSQEQLDALLTVGSGVVPDKVAITVAKEPGVPGKREGSIKDDHPHFKGSMSLTAFYKTGAEGKDLLVITYQLATMNKPSLVPGKLLEGAGGAFVGGVAGTISGVRCHFSEKKNPGLAK